MIDDNEFFRNATLRICGNLAIEEAMCNCVHYLEAFIPVDRMFLQVYEPDLAAMRTTYGGRWDERGGKGLRIGALPVR